MTFEEAVRNSMKAYWNGMTPDKLNKASDKRLKYTKKYFDKMMKDYEIENPWIVDEDSEGV